MADIKFACGEKALGTTTGNIELTISGLGWTPKAIITFTSSGTTNGTVNTFAQYAVGACDGDSEWLCGIIAENGDPSTTLARQAMTDECVGAIADGSVAIEGSGVGDGSGSNPGPISDGWRVNIGAAPTGTDRLCKFILLGGTDIKVNVGVSPALGVLDNTTTVTLDSASGDGQFEADLVFFGCIGEAFADSNSSFGPLSLGAAANNATPLNRVIATNSDAGADPSSCFGVVDTSYCAGQHSSAASWDWAVECDNYTSTSFDLTVREGNSGGDKVGYIAINVGAGDFWVGSVDSPTSAGSDWTVTSPGFEPVGVALLQSFFTAENSHASDATARAPAAAMFDGTREHCNGISEEDNQATTDTQSLCHNQALYYAQPDGTVEFDASNPTLESNGWKIAAADITSANGTARKWVGWAIGAGTAAGAAHVPSGLALLGVGS